MEDEESVTRETILNLMEKKDEIEAKLRELKEILDCVSEYNNIGMSEPLVDREGYPRHDIDVYQVRQARHKIICLQNDHKLLMSQIEKGLHFLHSNVSFSSSDNVTKANNKETEAKAFAKIIQVDSDSPASLTGLLVGDLIISFGSINSDNFKSMQDIASVVQHSVGRNIAVVIKRGSHVKSLALMPKEWKGKGLLGCVIVGLENIERTQNEWKRKEFGW